METAVENELPYSLSARWAPGLSEKMELQDFNQPKGTPMTDDRLALCELAAKSGDSDFLRTIAGSVLQLIMEADVDGLIGAGRYERGDGRQTWRNGYRDRSLDTRLGTLNLKIPKMRQGACFPGFLEPRKMVEKALVAVIQEAWINGVSTRKVDELVQAMGMTGISKSSVSKLCKDIDERVNAFLKRPLSGDWPYLWLDATYLKVREGGRIVSVAAIIAVAVNTGGKREIVGLHIGPSEAEPFWTSFLRDLVRRGLTGVKLVISDAHEGLKAAITRILSATWQRCRVMRCATRWPMFPRASTPWLPPRSGKPSSSPTTTMPCRPGGMSPTSSGPDGRSWEPSWTMPRPMCWPTWRFPLSTAPSSTAPIRWSG